MDILMITTDTAMITTDTVMITMDILMTYHQNDHLSNILEKQISHQNKLNMGTRTPTNLRDTNKNPLPHIQQPMLSSGPLLNYGLKQLVQHC